MSTDGASFLRDELGLDLGVRSYTIKGLGIAVSMIKMGDEEEVQDMEVCLVAAARERRTRARPDLGATF